MAKLPRTALVGILLRDRFGGRVRVDREGVAVVDYRSRGNDALICDTPSRQPPGARSRGPRDILAAPRRDVSIGRAEKRRVRTGSGAWTPRCWGPNELLLVTFHQNGIVPHGNNIAASVVDPEHRVWGTRGLYVSDASTFPSASGVQPDAYRDGDGASRRRCMVTHWRVTCSRCACVATIRRRLLAIPRPAASSLNAGTQCRGSAGARYWQQRADYTLEATLDTATNSARQGAAFYYVNRSPIPRSRVGAARSESVRSRFDIHRLESAAATVRRWGGLRLQCHRIVGGITVDASRRQDAHSRRRWRHHDAGRAAAAPRAQSPHHVRHCLALPDSAVWRRPHGSRGLALLRARPVVSADGGVRTTCMAGTRCHFWARASSISNSATSDVSLTVPAGSWSRTGGLPIPRHSSTAGRPAAQRSAFTCSGDAVVQGHPTPAGASAALTALARNDRTWRFPKRRTPRFAWAAGLPISARAE